MPDLLDVIDAVVATQESIEGVQKAWPYSPPQSQTVIPVCFTNSWDLGPAGNMGGNRYLEYAIEMQLYVGEATGGNDTTLAARATAFWPLILQAFQQKNAGGVGGIQLHNVINGVSTHTATWSRFRGGSPTLAILPRGGKNYIGLQLFLDLGLSGESFIPS